MQTMPITKIAIADDHAVFREGLAFIIGSHENYQILFDVANGKELLEKLPLHRPDVVLLDLRMPLIDGFQATKEIREDFPNIKIIVLTMHSNDDFILNLLDLGVNSYLLKNTSSKEVIHAIDSVMEKGYYFDELTTEVMFNRLRNRKLTKSKNKKWSQEIDLTPREKEIMGLILKEYNTNEIAEMLDLSSRTIDTHRTNIFAKFEVKNLVGLVIKAIQMGYLSLEDANEEEDSESIE
jgi:DNA-binding NarL/FixJ family response regulator